MVLRGLVAVWIVVAIALDSASAFADAAEVEALIAKGNELRRSGTPGPALPYFQKAYDLARTPRTAAQLGLGELAAGYPLEAADHLAAALQSPNDPAIVKYRQMLGEALKMARSQIGELAIQGNPAGAEVVIDGRVVGALPLPSSIKVAARNTEVVIRAPGFATRRELLSIAGGQRHELTVSLEKVEKPAEPGSLAVPVASPPPSAHVPAFPTPEQPIVVEDRPIGTGSPATGFSLRAAAWLCGGAAVAATSTGVVLNLAANAKASNFDASCAGSPTSGITPAPGVAASLCQDRYGSWEFYRRWAIAGYVTGAVLAVTSTVLFVGSRPPLPATPVHAHLACVPAPHGLSCEGSF